MHKAKRNYRKFYCTKRFHQRRSTSNQFVNYLVFHKMTKDEQGTAEKKRGGKCAQQVLGTAGRRRRRQHKTEFDEDEWSLAYAPREMTMHS